MLRRNLLGCPLIIVNAAYGNILIPIQALACSSHTIQVNEALSLYSVHKCIYFPVKRLLFRDIPRYHILQMFTYNAEIQKKKA